MLTISVYVPSLRVPSAVNFTIATAIDGFSSRSRSTFTVIFPFGRPTFSKVSPAEVPSVSVVPSCCALAREPSSNSGHTLS